MTVIFNIALWVFTRTVLIGLHKGCVLVAFECMSTGH